MGIAKTILNQVTTLTPKMVLWSWGASAFKSISENQIKGIGEDYLGALMFYVRGQKHKGHLVISLALDDSYTVSIGHVRKGVMRVKTQVSDVHFPELPGVIDNLIETK